MEKQKDLEVGLTMLDNQNQLVDGIQINSQFAKGPFLIDGKDTVSSLFLKRCIECKDKVVHREKDLGIWKAYTWGDFYENVRKISLGLNFLGFKRGDKASILAEDSKEWIYADIATQCLGGVSSGIYTTDSADQLEYLLNDSESTVLFLDNDEQLDKFLSIVDKTPKILKAIVFERDNLHNFSHEKVIFLDEVYELGDRALHSKPYFLEEEVEKNKPQDLAILVYTSGTTGYPKGVMLDNENLMYAMSIGKILLPTNSEDENFCFLPLCHIYERFVSCLKPIADKSTVNFAESLETIFEDIKEVSPTVFSGVPRIYEKIYSNFTMALSDSTNFSKSIYNIAISISLKCVELKLDQKRIPIILRLQFLLFEFLVFRNIRQMIGMNNVRRALTGAAPISPDLLKWFLAIGIRLVEGYGMSETFVMSVNEIDNNKLGSVGKIAQDALVRIDSNGEILWKSPGTFKGYYNDNKKTSEAFTKDGYFRTGDKGKLENGFLYITGRLKDIIITAGGKNISPAEIENHLKFSNYVSDCIVIGDRRKYVTALILIDRDNVEKYAQKYKIQYSDFSSLCNNNKILELIWKEVDQVNKKLARVEQIKTFRLIDILLTAEDDEMTATMKLKRGFVEEKYRDLIDAMYN